MNMIKQSKLSIDQLCPDQRILYCCFYSTDHREQQSLLPQEEGYLTWKSKCRKLKSIPDLFQGESCKKFT
ncbi:unnamed protein product [Musa acuminata subsp. malaccensis]|uniref:(wild Malaysian banana) hypothetical protein n=1 Tax=Musa acuminata subsp. malaccensis TaxID=214687 RepID=A0A804HQS6_MUSAM|nr:unnamed protein product [Musa acuminata subsp. malaccensis]